MSGVLSTRSASRRPRSEWVAEANRLRAQGLNGNEVARHLGLSHTFVSELLHDPTGEKAKARKQRYAGVCVDCGKPTSGCEGRRSNPRCVSCAQTKWTRGIIIELVREWAQLHGQPPAAYDWDPGLARGMGYGRAAELFERDSRWPYTTTVQSRFGSWANAIEAAGFTRPRVGVYRSEREASK